MALPTLNYESLAGRELANLPPALVVSAEYDPLRDEGEAYGQRLQDEWVVTEIIRYDGMMHGFVQMNALIPTGRAALTKCVQAPRKLCFKRSQQAFALVVRSLYARASHQLKL